MSAGNRVVFERIEVGSDCIDAVVRVTESSYSRTSAVPGLSQPLLDLLPGLRRHTCENGSAHGIVAEFADTETPHLLEHIAFELMALAGSPRTLKGETSWDFSADGVDVYHVRLAFDNDLVALGALRFGGEIVEWLLRSGEVRDAAGSGTPDIERIVARLRLLRGGEGKVGSTLR